MTCGCDETGYGYFVKAAITGCTRRGNLEAKGELIILPPLIARPCGCAVHTGYPWVANTVIHRFCGKTLCCLIIVSLVVEAVIETITRRFQGVVNATVAKRTFRKVHEFWSKWFGRVFGHFEGNFLVLSKMPEDLTIELPL